MHTQAHITNESYEQNEAEAPAPARAPARAPAIKIQRFNGTWNQYIRDG